MAISNKSQNWFLKYKLHYPPLWFLYHYLWWSFYHESFVDVAIGIFESERVLPFFSYILIHSICSYFILHILVPKFLSKGKILVFITTLTISIVVAALLIFYSFALNALVLGQDYKELYGMDDGSYFAIFKLQTFPGTLMAMTFALFIKLTQNWVRAQKHQRKLEKEKLETELKFLKSQFNPHFLFNTINSIFVLIHKNQEMASESLAKFSGLLRYQLYECNEAQIPLERELSYLQSFIELEELRLNEDLEFKCELPTIPKGKYSIAPFVLMPFVENAFKHVSKDDLQKNYIELTMELQDTTLIFDVKNTKPMNQAKPRDAVKKFGGLGLTNVKRRLELVYPNEFELNINDQAEYYHVSLRLKLQESNSDQKEIKWIQSNAS